MQAKGIVAGWDDGTYRPLNDTNRDAMAAFIHCAVNYVHHHPRRLI